MLVGKEIVPNRITKTSTKKINVEEEIKLFYITLVSAEGEVRNQAQALSTKTREDNGSYHEFDVQIVDWFPAESSWNVDEGISDMTGRFLAIQPIGTGRGRYASYETALVAEFEAIHVITPKNSRLTIKFLGFRNPNLLPQTPQSNSQRTAPRKVR